jgi:hypothetical protein
MGWLRLGKPASHRKARIYDEIQTNQKVAGKGYTVISISGIFSLL